MAILRALWTEKLIFSPKTLRCSIDLTPKHRWICFDQVSTFCAFRFPHGIIVSVHVLFLFYVLKFFCFQIAHLRRFWICSLWKLADCAALIVRKRKSSILKKPYNWIYNLILSLAHRMYVLRGMELPILQLKIKFEKQIWKVYFVISQISKGTFI